MSPSLSGETMVIRMDNLTGSLTFLDTVSSSIAYGTQYDDVTTIDLYSDKDETFAGLAYVPNVSSLCQDNSSDIPARAPSLTGLFEGYRVIAVHPLDACSQSVLVQARMDGASSVIFYNSTSSVGNSYSAAELRTAGVDLPTFVLPAASGTALIKAMADYSSTVGNVTDGNRNLLLREYRASDLIRVVLSIDMDKTSKVPNYWLLLIIIVAILTLLVLLVSSYMHATQILARRSLRRRLSNGQVNLESLGYRSLTAPKSIVDGMPLLTYRAKRPQQGENEANSADERNDDGQEEGGEKESSEEARGRDGSVGGGTAEGVAEGMEIHDGKDRAGPAVVEMARQEARAVTPPGTSARSSVAELRASLSGSEGEKDDEDDGEAGESAPHGSGGVTFGQTSCAICLDDYVSGKTRVRELPCKHVFHPACIDPFLERDSCLCPLCKQSVLPKNYVPENLKITTAMVIRERQYRQRGSLGLPLEMRGASRRTGAMRPNDLLEVGRRRLRHPGQHSAAGLTEQHPDVPGPANTDAPPRPPWPRRLLDSMFPYLAERRASQALQTHDAGG